MLRRNNTNLVLADGDLDRDAIMERGGWRVPCLCRYLVVADDCSRGNQYIGHIFLAGYGTRENKIMEAGDDGMF